MVINFCGTYFNDICLLNNRITESNNLYCYRNIVKHIYIYDKEKSSTELTRVEIDLFHCLLRALALACCRLIVIILIALHVRLLLTIMWWKARTATPKRSTLRRVYWVTDTRRNLLMICVSAHVFVSCAVYVSAKHQRAVSVFISSDL